MLASGRRPGIAALATLAVVVALLVLGGDGGAPSGDHAARGPARAGATVTRVVDGDTVEVSLAGRTETVRYIGVDTPESVDPDEPVQCYAERASRFNEQLVEGRRLALRFDAERRDRYGRLLAYARVGPRLVNAALVRRGLARSLPIPPNTEHAALFDRLEQRAADAGRGLWGRC